MCKEVLLQIAVALFQLSVMSQTYYEVKDNRMPPLWVFVPRLIAVTFPVVILLIGGGK